MDNLAKLYQDQPIIEDMYYLRLKELEDMKHGKDYDDMIKELQGNNKRNIKFLDIQGNDEGHFVDPWDNRFYVLFDTDYNGIISRAKKYTESDAETRDKYVHGVVFNNLTTTIRVSGTDTTVYYPLRYSVVVWSKGPDKKSTSDDASDKTNKDNIYSFSTIWSSSNGHTIQK